MCARAHVFVCVCARVALSNEHDDLFVCAVAQTDAKAGVSRFSQKTFELADKLQKMLSDL